MAVSFYLDHNVDRAIADGLRRRGVDLLTAYEDGRHRADDSALIDRATALGRVAVSSDRDFIREAHRRQRDGIDFAGVIYAPQSIPIGPCINDLALVAEASDPHDLANTLLFLPLG